MNVINMVIVQEHNFVSEEVWQKISVFNVLRIVIVGIIKDVIVVLVVVNKHFQMDINAGNQARANRIIVSVEDVEMLSGQEIWDPLVMVRFGQMKKIYQKFLGLFFSKQRMQKGKLLQFDMFGSWKMSMSEPLGLSKYVSATKLPTIHFCTFTQKTKCAKNV